MNRLFEFVHDTNYHFFFDDLLGYFKVGLFDGGEVIFSDEFADHVVVFAASLAGVIGEGHGLVSRVVGGFPGGFLEVVKHAGGSMDSCVGCVARKVVKDGVRKC